MAEKTLNLLGIELTLISIDRNFIFPDVMVENTCLDSMKEILSSQTTDFLMAWMKYKIFPNLLKKTDTKQIVR